MHEAGVAVAVAAEIRDRGLDPSTVRVLVRGGHGDSGAFEAAFRAQLELAAPGLGLDLVTLVRLSTARLCSGCARSFTATDPDAPCPACGRPGLTADVHETIELEWDEVPAAGGPHSPLLDDSRHSIATAGETEADTMRRPLSSSRA
jgi:hypothetical protein